MEIKVYLTYLETKFFITYKNKNKLKKFCDNFCKKEKLMLI